ncbi:M20 aminoacylase family protein [Cupriavidus sp. UME77]|uniref:M20 aminoacylase family protein n=1 Tax=Cupriavidus sp. UME77 TaxID=1862321 RepID=UPI0015FF3618|nr:M20 aminoacylase family protein [Cupriavidus sp. UME77]
MAIDSKAGTKLPDLLPLHDELAALRQHIHRHPELAFEEYDTADLVAGKLQEWGYQVTRGIGKTGLVGQLRVGKGDRRLGLRADMDALPIQEDTGLPYASSRPGLMHACGHDGHTAMLLGAAKHLAATRNFSGTLNLIFQPAEERGFDSGAKSMVADGLFERLPCDMVFAMHNHPGVPQGRFLMRPGPFLAAGDRVFIKVVGLGGHAARPHLAVDPLVAAAAIVMAIQTVVSRNVPPNESAVLTVGRLRAGDALNVIPGEAEIGISVRSFSPEVRALLRDRITTLVKMTAESYGAKAEIRYVEGYPVVDNAADAVALAAEVAMELVGEEDVDRNYPKMMGSEDFAYMLQECPGALVRIGNGPSDGGRGLHNPRYDFNDSNLALGAAFWSRLTETFLV